MTIPRSRYYVTRSEQREERQAEYAAEFVRTSEAIVRAQRRANRLAAFLFTIVAVILFVAAAALAWWAWNTPVGGGSNPLLPDPQYEPCDEVNCP